MEQRWKDAAQTGNIDALYELFRQNPNLLEDIDSVSFIDTPMHIAASAGQTSFAIEVMSLKPSFSKKLNPDGLSPLHLALRNGHHSTVEGLVKFDPELVRVKGRGRITPLHYVADVDDADLLRTFILSCPKSVEDLTIGRETAVHIAVKRGHVEALKALLDCVEKTKNEQILNWSDHRGYAVVHIAAATNDFEAVKMLIIKKVDITIKNLEGLKAIDLATDQRIIDVLRNEELSISSLKSKKSLKRMIRNILLRFLLGSRKEISSMEEINALLVIAALIATATYQTVLSPTGGFSSGDGSNVSPSPLPGGPAARAGKVQMNEFDFKFYTTVNTIAFLSSITMIWILLVHANNSRLLKVSLFFLSSSYGLSLRIIQPRVGSARFLIYPLMGLSAITFVIMVFLKFRSWFHNRRRASSTITSFGR